MIRKLAGKKAIITGGSRGIGKHIALAFAEEGADILITYNTQKEEARNVINEIIKMGGHAHAVQADISSNKDRSKIVEEAIVFLGQINILVNNAGIYNRIDYLEIKEDDYDKMMGINMKGSFFLTQLVCKEMVKQGKGGSIINISSFRDRAVTSGLAHYQISKAALTIFSKSLGVEMAKHKIRVNTISPGMVVTDMLHNIDKNSSEWSDRIRSIPLNRAGSPQDLCPLAVLLASDQSSYVTASRFLVDGGRSNNPANLPLRSNL